jgi:hypothetical protein
MPITRLIIDRVIAESSTIKIVVAGGLGMSVSVVRG